MNRRRSKISSYKQNKLLVLFVGGVTARTAAELAGINRHSATLYYQKIRAMIAQAIEDETPFDGEIEIDESYFGGQRKGKQGRGAARKIPVFGLLKRGGKVHAKIIPNASSKALIPIITSKIKPDSIIYSDGWKAYHAIDVTKFRHHRINHSELFAQGHNHINGIENFWNQAKRMLRRYNGIPAAQFNFFLQECVFRFNYGSVEQQLATLKSWKNNHLPSFP